MIRIARSSDIPQIRTLLHSVPGMWNESWPPNVLDRALSSADAVAIVHDAGEAIDGFACAHDLGFRAYLSELVVAQDAQGGGLGSRLLREIERQLADRGRTVVIADVWRDAERFYRANGWDPPPVVLLGKHLKAAV